MIRTCCGTDPNLLAEDRSPCACGLTFDDVERMVTYPHDMVRGGGRSIAEAVAREMGLDPGAPMPVEQRDALPGTMAPGLSPVTLTMTDEEAAEFRERFDAAMEEQKAHPLVTVFREPLSPEEIRALLRECVTVVKFSETLIIRVPSGSLNPQQHCELSDVVRYQGRENGFRAMLVMGDELAVAETAS
jgi:hypothetical protein